MDTERAVLCVVGTQTMEHKYKKMEFKEWGVWLYSMLGAQGEEHFCRAEFKAVTPSKNFEMRDGFCDTNSL